MASARASGLDMAEYSQDPGVRPVTGRSTRSGSISDARVEEGLSKDRLSVIRCRVKAS